ncbi:MAG TPA: hypothetical protein VK957_12390 [Lunatimonas sp.]|nr:hypothetical protein [Lunatimonas sp.]
MKLSQLIFNVSLFFFLYGCSHSSETDTYSELGTEAWLKGNTDEKLEEVAHQLGGFSRTMVEVGYRYGELYWAGEDENWKYADHQLEHIMEAMEDGLKRRPVRAVSAVEFMEKTIPEMEEAIASEDKDSFLAGYKTFTAGCNACHAKEGEGFIVIQQPLTRLSPVRF